MMLFVISLLPPCCLAQARGGSAQGYAFEISDILGRAQLSGSLEYWGVCDWSNGLDLPKIRPSSGKEIPPIDELRAMFAVDSMMQVIQSDGKIRMVENDVPADILNVKVHHVVLPGDILGPTSARFAILQAPEVRKFRREHNIGPKSEWASAAGPNFEGPLSEPVAQVELNDVTVAEAFDHTLQMYPGYWLYENCRNKNGERIVYFSFYKSAPPSFYASQERAKGQIIKSDFY
jgi:hypothetical protein